jgi:hypothetical protein
LYSDTVTAPLQDNEDLRAAEVAAISNGLERLGLQYGLGLPSHIGQLRPV